MWDIFSFEQVRYTTVEHLAEDIMNLARSRATATASRLADLTALQQDSDGDQAICYADP